MAKKETKKNNEKFDIKEKTVGDEPLDGKTLLDLYRHATKLIK